MVSSFDRSCVVRYLVGQAYGGDSWFDSIEDARAHIKGLNNDGGYGYSLSKHTTETTVISFYESLNLFGPTKTMTLEEEHHG